MEMRNGYSLLGECNLIYLFDSQIFCVTFKVATQKYLTNTGLVSLIICISEENGTQPQPAVITHHTPGTQGSALPDFDYSDDEYDDEAPPIAPVQGQRRLQKGRKSKNGPIGPGDKRSSCKQQ